MQSIIIQLDTVSLPSLKEFHRKSYPAISPGRSELSQEGRTVVITGGNSGIGYAIARGFVTANASTVIIIGRRAAVVDSAVARLVEDGKRVGSKSSIQGHVYDISDLASAAAFWTGLHKQGVYVHVLVLNAATSGPAAPILEAGSENVWATFEANVRSTLTFSEHFYKQDGKNANEHKVRIILTGRLKNRRLMNNLRLCKSSWSMFPRVQTTCGQQWRQNAHLMA